MTMPLENVRIVDFTDQIAGAYTTMLLAACGAQVIRVESQLGRGFRKAGPFGYRGNGVVPKELREMPISPTFGELNRGKSSIALNMSNPQGIDLAKQLIKISDVVIDNFRFGVMEKWGLDYPNLQKIKKDIIFITLKAMGASGPYREWRVWGPNLMSFTGFAYAWGHPDVTEVVGVQEPYVDYLVSSHAASVILSALLYWAKSGKGQYIDISQSEVGASLLGTIYLDYFVNSRNTHPRGNRHPQYAPYNCYRCRGDDRWCVIAIFNEDDWQNFCDALYHPSWTADIKFKDMESRLKYSEELDKHIEEWTRQYTPHQVMRILQGFGIAAGAVQNGEDLYGDIQLRASNFMEKHELPRVGKITYPGIAIRFSETPIPKLDTAPSLGEQNRYVYHDLLGLSSGKINTLVREGIIF